MLEEEMEKRVPDGHAQSYVLILVISVTKKIKNKKGSLRTYNELFEEGTMKRRLTGGVGLSK